MDMQEFKTLLLLVLVAIASKGDDGCPSGHVYAEMMGKCNLGQYEAVVKTLVSTGWITKEKNHLLKVTQKGQEISERVAAIVG